MKQFEDLGLHDYRNDPEILNRVLKENDLNIKFTLIEALLLITAVNSYNVIISTNDQEFIQNFANNMFNGVNDQREIISKDLLRMKDELFKEIYRKQRELYADKDN